MNAPIICPEPERLVGMLDDKLADSEQARVTEHVTSCETCQQRLDSLVTHGLREDLHLEDLGDYLRRAGQENVALSRETIQRLTTALCDATAACPEQSGEISLDFLQPSEEADSLGRLGQYEITEVIGRGGMGIALKARDTRLDRIVAIKVLAPELASNPTARRRFLREAQAAAAVSHDHVVTTFAVEPGNLPYLAMEYIDGLSLQQKLDHGGPLELREILRIGMQTASGLAAAHAQGLIHRDIKPSNILLQNNVERVQITDFGLARAVDDVSITRTGDITGTPQYMSPEQASGRPADQRTDLFSLGSVLYAMCTGRSPFRAESTVAVLHRVCNDAPRSIRDVNPDIPDWLVAIIDRLLEKNPDDRFQTAAEVADVLSQYLAHVQQPTVVPLPELILGTSRIRTRFSWGPKWYVGAILLAIVLGSLALTEATGVTNLAGTVIRIAMGEGTLVIEVDDPTVEVSLDGEELSITGAGIQELRLRPGQYQFQALKDGEPVKRELVTITRGDRQVVRVTREPTDVHPAIEGAIEQAAVTGAFVVLGGDGDEYGKFDTLAEAVNGSSYGDTIEIRGNGPFATDCIEIKHRLIIRAANGFRPLLDIRPLLEETEKRLWLTTNSPLVLEGLELRRVDHTPKQRASILVSSSSVYCANCRFVVDASGGTCIMSEGSDRVVRNCEFLVRGGAAHGGGVKISGARYVADNCVQAGYISFGYSTGTEDATVQLTRNTLLNGRGAVLIWVCDSLKELPPEREAAHWLGVDVSRNVFGIPNNNYLSAFGVQMREIEHTPLSEIGDFLRRVVDLHDRLNLYPTDRNLLGVDFNVGYPDSLLKPEGRQELAEWNRFWGLTNTGSLQGQARFEGGDLLSKAVTNPQQLTPEDFRLRPDSPGYQAGPDGKDLGADIDLVGPGEAYDRWKQTPEYQEWQKETSELMKAAAADQPEDEAVSEKGTAEESQATNREDDQLPVEDSAEEPPAPSDS